MNRHPLLDVERIEQAPDVYLDAVGRVFAVFGGRTQGFGKHIVWGTNPTGTLFRKDSRAPR